MTTSSSGVAYGVPSTLNATAESPAMLSTAGKR
jgi:hypothetical protein